jgi:hypothetical protein
MEEKLNLAYSKLDELLEVRKDYPMTTNYDFINTSKLPRQGSSNGNLEAILRGRLGLGQDVSVDEITRMLSAMTSKADLDMDMVAAEEAFDNMDAYYKVCSPKKTQYHSTDTFQVAMNLFTDNVPTLAVQAPIIREVPKIFCPTAVFSMDTDVINRIAGESEEKIIERDSVLHRLATLEKGALICKQYAKRPQHGKYVVNFCHNTKNNNYSSQPFARRREYIRAANQCPTSTGKRQQRKPSEFSFGCQTGSWVRC